MNVLSERAMPEISRFYGLVILMNYNDHRPPHFHVWYGDYKATITINDGIVKGEMPKRALSMIFNWLDEHKEELLKDWELAQNSEPLIKISPLI